MPPLHDLRGGEVARPSVSEESGSEGWAEAPKVGITSGECVPSADSPQMVEIPCACCIYPSVMLSRQCDQQKLPLPIPGGAKFMPKT